jgi:hypothetical protein
MTEHPSGFTYLFAFIGFLGFMIFISRAFFLRQESLTEKTSKPVRSWHEVKAPQENLSCWVWGMDPQQFGREPTCYYKSVPEFSY